MNISSKLNDIKDYVRKLGEKRRAGDKYEIRIKEAKLLYATFEQFLQACPATLSKDILCLCINIRKSYSSILNYSKPSLSNMSDKEQFCLKTAVSLMPKMNGDESVTRELIDSIELYDSMLDGGKTSLINFVLKTRISDSAKMRLNSEYSNVSMLLKDMRLHLLTQKSDTSLQTKLQYAKQGNKSIKDFGEEIEKLFVDLTISQASGNQDAFKVLRPVNERNAIKRFADGLQSQRLSTIVAARNFSHLKDAIRAAEDEHISRPEQMLPYSRSKKIFFNKNRGNYKYNSPNKHVALRNDSNTYRPGYIQRYARQASDPSASNFRRKQCFVKRGRITNMNDRRSLHYCVDNNQSSKTNDSRNDTLHKESESEFFRR